MKAKLKELLVTGLPMYSLKSFSEEEVAALVQEYKNKDETQGKEKLVLKLLIHQIDGK